MANTFTMVDPRGLDFKHWSSLMTQELAGFVGLPSRVEEKNWKDWARIVYGSQQVGTNVADPRHFDDWREWAASWVMTGN